MKRSTFIIVLLTVLCYATVGILGCKPEASCNEPSIEKEVFLVSNESSSDVFIIADGKQILLRSGTSRSFETGVVYVVYNNKSHKFSLTEDIIIDDSLLSFLDSN